MTERHRTRLLAAAFALIVIASAPITIAALARSAGEFGSNLGRSEPEVKRRLYGEFYPAMINYLEHIPADENAVIMQPPAEFAHHFWVLNYYFLPRRIYEPPASGIGMEPVMGSRRVRHAIYTRPDGFFFDRYPPVLPDVKP